MGDERSLAMIRIIRQEEYIEGLWRNGQGVSWEIASFKKEGAADFSWRFAKARIDHDVPFSIYPGMDRIFMMIEGQGMDLEFEGGKVLQVHERFVPHLFSCDVPLVCKLRGGPSLDLNLFTARGKFRANCEVKKIRTSENFLTKSTVTVVYVLEGDCVLNGTQMKAGDSAFIGGQSSVEIQSNKALLFLGHLQN
jgi:environmental stress-induced protein Ves